jgi:very-short-patch-repair endonuclease
MPLSYNPNLKHLGQQLRKNMTESENRLWSKIRGRQILNVQFYRQKPIGDYIVDFYAPKVKLVVEVDGSQHLDAESAAKDRIRDGFMGRLSLKVLRFNSMEVLEKTESVLEVIYRTMNDRLSGEIPLDPPLPKGEVRSGTAPLKTGETEIVVPPLKKGDRGI